MSMMIDILMEEKRRLETLIQEYDEQISGLPRGSISWKKRKSGEYGYLAYRVADSVKFDYLGKKGAEKPETIARKIKRRRELEMKRREALRNLKQIDRMLHAAKKPV
ncbi:MAG: hypothetical protein GXO69_00725 [Acidobacteria bacterium]|nr:hypothetical protein [Acidobacteriota bacterium]